MLVSEAKEKICPFIQDLHKQGVATTVDNGRNYPININCICSECMAWVETKEYTDEKTITLSDTYNDKWRKDYERHNEPYRVISVTPRLRHIEVKIGIKKDENSGYCTRLENG